MYQVLLLDDEPMAIKACEHALAWADYGMEVARTFLQPGAALDWLVTHPADLAFVDLRMPGMDGFAFIDAARQIRPDLLFVILSGFDDFDYVRRAFHARAFDYCLKPIHSRENQTLMPTLEVALCAARIHTDRRLFASDPPGRADFPLPPQAADPFYLVHVTPPAPHAANPDDPDRVLRAGSNERIRALTAFGGAHLMDGPDKMHFLIPADGVPGGIARYLDRTVPDAGAYPKLIFTAEPCAADALPAVWPYWLRETRIRRHGRYAVARADAPAGNTLADAAVQHLHRHYTEPLTLQALAAELHISYAYCSELIRKHTGMTFSHYLNHLRLSHAAELLVTTDTPIRTIALDVGYNSEQYFARTFHRTFGMSAGTYRRNRRSAP